MPRTTVAGHPLHPQLILLPAGLLPFSLVLDLLHRITGKREYADAAYYTMMGGSVGAVAAAAAGAGDYLTIPPNTPVKRTANIHAAMNSVLLTLYTVNLLLRRGKNPPTGPVPLLLSVIGTIGLLISAWYGGELVYAQGMRVRGVDPSAGRAEVRPPLDEQTTGMLQRAGDAAAPASGPRE